MANDPTCTHTANPPLLRRFCLRTLPTGVCVRRFLAGLKPCALRTRLIQLHNRLIELIQTLVDACPELESVVAAQVSPTRPSAMLAQLSAMLAIMRMRTRPPHLDV
jgi:hypothetical protein